MKVFKVTAEALNLIRLPERHWNARLDKIPNNCTHKKVIRLYLEDIVSNILKGQGLYLWGDYGRGKSAIAAMVLKAAASKCKFGLWVKAKDLPGYIIEKDQFDQDYTVFEKACEVPILVIDEFQVRKDIRFTETAVEDLIRRRIDNNLATVVTSNVVITELKDRYPALYSVIQEGLYPIKVQGHDFRGEMKGISPNA